MYAKLLYTDTTFGIPNVKPVRSVNCSLQMFNLNPEFPNGASNYFSIISIS